MNQAAPSDPAEMIVLMRLDQLPPGAIAEVVAAGRVVALFNVEGEIQALDGVCPHQGGPLGRGALCKGIVTCPWHGWQFDTRSGENQITRTIRQPRIPVQVAENQILVRRSDLADL